MNAGSDMRLNAIGVKPSDDASGAEGGRGLVFDQAVSAQSVGTEVVVLQSYQIVPTLVALHQRFEAIRRSELTRLERKLAALSPEAQTRLDEISRLIVEKLLVTPTEQLQSVSDEPMRVRYVGALNRLFRLPAEDQDKVEDSETTVPTR